MELRFTCHCDLENDDHRLHSSRPKSRRVVKAGGRRIVVGVILLMLGGSIWGAHPPAAKAEVLTLEQAIALAGENNRLVKNSSLDVEKAAAQADATRTRRLPGFSFKAQANQLLTPIEFTFAQGSFGIFRLQGPSPLKKPNSRQPHG